MSLSTAFLDEIRARTSLSALIGKAVKLEHKGKEHKGCCPFHSEKTPSFTVNDDKEFYHCFGCGAHGDAISWLTIHEGMDFMDAVKQLAQAAGLDMPAQSLEQAARARRAAHVSDVLGEAADYFARSLEPAGAIMEALAARGVDDAAIARFGIGYAPARGSIAAIGFAVDQLIAAGLIVEGDDGRRDQFRNRIMVPIHDGRGRPIGFGGRAIGENLPKYLNSAQSDHFDKGRVLFNLHRAAPASRAAKRLILVEGYFDVIALDQAGISEAVAPMGTAITPEQLERAWRVHHCPVLLLDGDAAGRKAAERACVRALPLIGPGRSLKIAMLPEGSDPDDLVRACGRDAIDDLVEAALSLSSYIWSGVLAAGDRATPEGRAAIWAELAGLAATVPHEETRAQYLAYWRRLFDEEFPPHLFGWWRIKSFQLEVWKRSSATRRRRCRNGCARRHWRACLVRLRRRSTSPDGMPRRWACSPGAWVGASGRACWTGMWPTKRSRRWRPMSRGSTPKRWTRVSTLAWRAVTMLRRC
ncbi:DNA primase [Sphingobium xenophagum]|uniref:DNA primase n=1 Tax=Sphingobium xenophagum TaxID=121428 RepID=A0A249MV27_SPHXE|nr:DNA primase [Sphingobium xenophagum]ASY44997.1 DNA primase [Sphingobium xenophagum]